MSPANDQGYHREPHMKSSEVTDRKEQLINKDNEADGRSNGRLNKKTEKSGEGGKAFKNSSCTLPALCL